MVCCAGALVSTAVEAATAASAAIPRPVRIVLVIGFLSLSDLIGPKRRGGVMAN
jgi:hypothetical protein